jgi:hypothetical protein
MRDTTPRQVCFDFMATVVRIGGHAWAPDGGAPLGLQNQRMCALHPNIVQLREVFLTADYLAVAMEYADGGDVSEHIDQQYQKGVSVLAADRGPLSPHTPML